ncbi:hypothetical protein HD554DRAFT_2171123 [Boletus coccyginus]|nr:hypothetical protein HD554DRAFT_2171123 [Boletus coccyginus]
MIFYLLAVVCSLLSLVSALPVVAPVVRDVWVPQILSPDASTIWAAGGTYTVLWDTSSEPAQVTNSEGLVYLRINGATQSTPLAQGFPLTDGHVDVTIPADTVPADDWVVVLFGDSGNWSPPFTIEPST